mmetsp:Transcript_26668/g.58056  ORF Transcript_26668/g.58056 Transcript_26668/m.58056 type:complete len:194 (-) Transcript_26668:437-1018(-)|eukprot:CAMPEP_0118929070 /NCGR_PEP_ID=MMETSP1169-20130426/6174_1 /TAXON_ID=36882 /ORGANISM="Pyramimonas obovata, Strain CCMP722" /LENGTH=193 /DNA_ID=CAMNT_0006871193 /DNA_START=126 /DNA_END=707 /DNA_ORIENTATION=+
MPNNKSASVPLILAACGYAYTTWHTQASDQRRAQIERVNEQVKELYGPLFMCITATKSAYDAMVRQHSTDGTLHTFEKSIKSNPHCSEACAYRSWVREVFMPLNLQAAKIIMTRADLLESSTIEPLLQQLVAHVSALKVIIKQWDDGDLAATSVIPYPDDLLMMIHQQYMRIKKRQAALLGMNNYRMFLIPRL